MNPEPIRELALRILLKLNTGSGYAQNIMDKAIRDLGLVDPEKSFLTELVYGTVRWQGNLDWIIGSFVPPRKLKKCQPEIIEILRLGLYQLLFLDNVPGYAAVNESVELAKKYGNKGSAGLVNAVLHRSIREKIVYPNEQSDPAGYISARYSHPRWLVDRWVKRYGFEETIQLCSANNLRAPLYIRTNILKTSREQLMQSLEKDGLTASISPNLPESVEIIVSTSIDKLTSYKNGWFQVQDESSMLASRILDPQPGETIIDACAAPGGKTSHIAELMQNKGKVLAFDTDFRRLSLLKESCQRLGIAIVEAAEADARTLGDYEADRVLVDVPCTGLGILRRHVEIRWRRSPDQLQTFPDLQYAILEKSARHVRHGGILVYCTCTIEPEENQQVVGKFLSAHLEFQIQSVLPFLPEELKQKNLVSAEGYMQTYPHLHNMDGFFAARMARK